MSLTTSYTANWVSLFQEETVGPIRLSKISQNEVRASQLGDWLEHWSCKISKNVTMPKNHLI